MALIVENGSIVPNADSFGTVAEADTYHAAYGNTAWATFSAPNKDIFMRQAGRYLNTAFNYKGSRMSIAQTMCMPRSGVQTNDGYYVSSTSVPNEFKYAQFELALRAGNGEKLTIDVTPTSRVKRKKTDVLETEYVDGAPTQTAYKLVENMLVDYTTSTTNTSVVQFNRV